ncbi:MAG: ATP-binding protein [Olegusella sp.]|nr:ATP-binding protein [Olegusella sp.]
MLVGADFLTEKEKKEKLGKKGKFRKERKALTRDEIFSPSFGNRPTYLVGRSAVLKRLDQCLSSRPGSRDRATVMLGQRGSGKTVLLWELADRARQAGFAVATPTIVADGMLDRIVEKIQDDGSRYIPADGPHVTGGSLGFLGFSAGLQFSREVQETKSAAYRLTSLVRALSAEGHGTLILVDELQANSNEVRELVATYQELVGEGLDVALVMAGLPAAVAATLNDKVLTFLNRAAKIELPPLADGDIDAFFSKAFAEAGVDVDAEKRRKAVQSTSGSPYMLQLVGYYLVAYADPDGSLADAAFSQALGSAKRDFENDVCQTTIAALSDRDIDFLVAMAEGDGPTKVVDIATRMQVTTDYAQKYRKRLIDAGVVSAPRRGYVEFAVPYLADYLRAQE